MSSKEYRIIQTPADIEEFQEVSNGLHDGYITHVAYNNTGIFAHDHRLYYDYRETSLTLHVLVTSLIGHPTFEIVFHRILEWQLRGSYCSEIIAFSLRFLEEGGLLWADDISSNIDDLKQGSYVIADFIQYRRL